MEMERLGGQAAVAGAPIRRRLCLAQFHHFGPIFDPRLDPFSGTRIGPENGNAEMPDFRKSNNSVSARLKTGTDFGTRKRAQYVEQKWSKKPEQKVSDLRVPGSRFERAPADGRMSIENALLRRTLGMKTKDLHGGCPLRMYIDDVP